MDDLALSLITIGVILLFGLAADVIGRRTKLPRVTLLLLFGLLIRQTPWFPENLNHWFPFITDLALLMIGFLLGEKLVWSFRGKQSLTVFWVSGSVVIVTAGLILGGLLLIGIPLEIALIFAGISTATDPAATTDVVVETKAKGNFSSTLLAIVAIDDAWGLILFSFLLALAQSIQGQPGSMDILLTGAWDLGGACLVGIMLGIPMALLTGRVRPGQPTLLEALGIVVLCGGISLMLNVSFILASMVLGGMVALLATHHEYPFHAIEDIEPPFMILFFVLAGASLDIFQLAEIGWLGITYIFLRILGRIFGSWPGALLAQAKPSIRNFTGMALMPQAGVALGMALVATNRFPELSQVIFPVVIGTTIFFELIGPILTRTALILAGDVARK